MTQNIHVAFREKKIERRKLEKQFECIFSLVKTHQNMYLAPKGQGQMLTAGHVPLRPNGDRRKSTCISIDKSRQAEHNETIPVALSVLVKSSKQKNVSDLHYLK